MTRILSFDDDPCLAEMVCMILEGAGFEAVSTSNIHEALLILRTQPIDLLIQDLARPIMNGDEFVRLLKDDNELRCVPVLLISGFTRTQAAKFLLEWGVDLQSDVGGYLKKPYSPVALLDAVEAILLRHGKSLPPVEVRERARAGWPKSEEG